MPLRTKNRSTRSHALRKNDQLIHGIVRKRRQEGRHQKQMMNHHGGRGDAPDAVERQDMSLFTMNHLRHINIPSYCIAAVCIRSCAAQSLRSWTRIRRMRGDDNFNARRSFGHASAKFTPLLCPRSTCVGAQINSGEMIASICVAKCARNSALLRSGRPQRHLVSSHARCCAISR